MVRREIYGKERVTTTLHMTEKQIILKYAITYRRKVGRERENKVYLCIFILYCGRYCRFCATDKRQNEKGEVVGWEN
jgi:hypothetical protein